jgi:hypothetical protein
MPIIISGSNGISGVDGTAGAPAVQGSDGDTGVFFPAVNQVALAAGGTQVLLGTSTGVTVTGTLQAGGSTLYPLVQGTAVASTSGTAIDFTGIPSWARRITVMLDGVSTNGSSNLLLQLGTSSGPETSGYRGTAFYPGATYSLLTSGVLLAQGGAAANITNGSLSFSLVTGNTWAGNGITSYSNSAAISIVSFAKALGGVLDRVRFTTVAGTDTFDAGNINIQYD